MDLLSDNRAGETNGVTEKDPHDKIKKGCSEILTSEHRKMFKGSVVLCSLLKAFYGTYVIEKRRDLCRRLKSYACSLLMVSFPEIIPSPNAVIGFSCNIYFRLLHVYSMIVMSQIPKMKA